mmetsp:Transcript_2204/g.5599  ORF Transcript_2204/g.5599 Transcript_2204/m.5599 type:complete len:308 (+) Transcript_2204:2208-3131(+)
MQHSAGCALGHEELPVKEQHLRRRLRQHGVHQQRLHGHRLRHAQEPVARHAAHRGKREVQRAERGRAQAPALRRVLEHVVHDQQQQHAAPRLALDVHAHRVHGLQHQGVQVGEGAHGPEGRQGQHGGGVQRAQRRARAQHVGRARREALEDGGDVQHAGVGDTVRGRRGDDGGQAHRQVAACKRGVGHACGQRAQLQHGGDDRGVHGAQVEPLVRVGRQTPRAGGALQAHEAARCSDAVGRKHAHEAHGGRAGRCLAQTKRDRPARVHGKHSTQARKQHSQAAICCGKPLLSWWWGVWLGAGGGGGA